jgi:Fur family transcriptional regulator, zinc uptake regulator
MKRYNIIYERPCRPPPESQLTRCAGDPTPVGGSLIDLQILEKAGSPKLKTPIQVYRALKTLTRLALVHRVETLSKYVACRCDHPQGAQPILTICDACGTVAELPDAPPMQRLEEMAAGGGFACRLIKVEVAGLCQSCRAEASV